MGVGAVLNYLFLDMNAYFASVEQQDLGLSGPVAVAPMGKVETTCIIAASSEARAYGIKTGTAVHEARRLCPTLRVVEARPKLYVEYHHKIIAAMESCLHVDHVTSIDEMFGRLMKGERKPEQAAGIGFRVKAAIREAVGPRVRCSIGISSSPWLAKVASDIHKPDGLTMILPEQCPEILYRLALTDLPGIAGGMSRRLAKFGIQHVYQLCALSEAQLSAAWGSKVHGAIWYAQLRGR
jgi:DNA polymerase-4